jgi:hypothetical protein
MQQQAVGVPGLEAPDDLCGSVLALVIYDQDLESRVVGRTERPDTTLDVRLFVPRRYDHAHKGQAPLIQVRGVGNPPGVPEKGDQIQEHQNPGQSQQEWGHDALPPVSVPRRAEPISFLWWATASWKL